jgi:hypothetical protein
MPSYGINTFRMKRNNSYDDKSRESVARARKKEGKRAEKKNYNLRHAIKFHPPQVLGSN